MKDLLENFSNTLTPENFTDFALIVAAKSMEERQKHGVEGLLVSRQELAGLFISNAFLTEAEVNKVILHQNQKQLSPTEWTTQTLDDIVNLLEAVRKKLLDKDSLPFKDPNWKAGFEEGMAVLSAEASEVGNVDTTVERLGANNKDRFSTPTSKVFLTVAVVEALSEPSKIPTAVDVILGVPPGSALETFHRLTPLVDHAFTLPDTSPVHEKMQTELDNQAEFIIHNNVHITDEPTRRNLAAAALFGLPNHHPDIFNVLISNPTTAPNLDVPNQENQHLDTKTRETIAAQWAAGDEEAAFQTAASVLSTGDTNTLFTEAKHELDAAQANELAQTPPPVSPTSYDAAIPAAAAIIQDVAPAATFDQKIAWLKKAANEIATGATDPAAVAQEFSSTDASAPATQLAAAVVAAIKEKNTQTKFSTDDEQVAAFFAKVPKSVSTNPQNYTPPQKEAPVPVDQVAAVLAGPFQAAGIAVTATNQTAFKEAAAMVFAGDSLPKTRNFLQKNLDRNTPENVAAAVYKAAEFAYAAAPPTAILAQTAVTNLQSVIEVASASTPGIATHPKVAAALDQIGDAIRAQKSEAEVEKIIPGKLIPAIKDAGGSATATTPSYYTGTISNIVPFSSPTSTRPSTENIVASVTQNPFIAAGVTASVLESNRVGDAFVEAGKKFTSGASLAQIRQYYTETVIPTVAQATGQPVSPAVVAAVDASVSTTYSLLNQPSSPTSQTPIPQAPSTSSVSTTTPRSQNQTISPTAQTFTTTITDQLAAAGIAVAVVQNNKDIRDSLEKAGKLFAEGKPQNQIDKLLKEDFLPKVEKFTTKPLPPTVTAAVTASAATLAAFQSPQTFTSTSTSPSTPTTYTATRSYTAPLWSSPQSSRSDTTGSDISPSAIAAAKKQIAIVLTAAGVSSTVLDNPAIQKHFVDIAEDMKKGIPIRTIRRRIDDDLIPEIQKIRGGLPFDPSVSQAIYRASSIARDNSNTLQEQIQNTVSVSGISTKAFSEPTVVAAMDQLASLKNPQEAKAFAQNTLLPALQSQTSVSPAAAQSIIATVESSLPSQPVESLTAAAGAAAIAAKSLNELTADQAKIFDKIVASTPVDDLAKSLTAAGFSPQLAQNAATTFSAAKSHIESSPIYKDQIALVAKSLSPNLDNATLREIADIITTSATSKIAIDRISRLKAIGEAATSTLPPEVIAANLHTEIQKGLSQPITLPKNAVTAIATATVEAKKLYTDPTQQADYIQKRIVEVLPLSKESAARVARDMSTRPLPPTTATQVASILFSLDQTGSTTGLVKDLNQLAKSKLTSDQFAEIIITNRLGNDPALATVLKNQKDIAVIMTNVAHLDNRVMVMRETLGYMGVSAQTIAKLTDKDLTRLSTAFTGLLPANVEGSSIKNPELALALLTNYTFSPMKATTEKLFQNRDTYNLALKHLLGTKVSEEFKRQKLDELVVLFSQVALKEQQLLYIGRGQDHIATALNMSLAYLKAQSPNLASEINQIQARLPAGLETFRNLIEASKKNYMQNLTHPDQVITTLQANKLATFIADSQNFIGQAGQFINAPWMETLRLVNMNSIVNAALQRVLSPKQFTQLTNLLAQYNRFAPMITNPAGYIQGRIQNAVVKRLAATSVGKAVSAAIAKTALKGVASKIGAAIGSVAIPIPGLGAIIGFIATEIIGRIVSRIGRFVKEHSDILIGGAVGLGALVATGSLLVGIGAGLAAFVTTTFIAGGSAAVATAGSSIGGTLIALLSAVGSAVVMPFLISVLVAPVVLAFFLVVINNSAFVLPPSKFVLTAGTGGALPNEFGVVLPIDPSGERPDGCWPFRSSDANRLVIQRGPGGSHENAIDISTGDQTRVPVGGYNVPVYATHNGTVTTRITTTGYGRHIILTNGSFSTIYAHLDRFTVADGAIVGRGTMLGYADHTGNSTGAHLHYEYRPTSVSVNQIVPPYTVLSHPSGGFAGDPGSCGQAGTGPAPANPRIYMARGSNVGGNVIMSSLTDIALGSRTCAWAISKGIGIDASINANFFVNATTPVGLAGFGAGGVKDFPCGLSCATKYLARGGEVQPLNMSSYPIPASQLSTMIGGVAGLPITSGVDARPRTIVGLKGSEIIIAVIESATTAQMAEFVDKLGISRDEAMSLDGGGSSTFCQGGTTLFGNTRVVPVSMGLRRATITTTFLNQLP